MPKQNVSANDDDVDDNDTDDGIATNVAGAS